jgi:small subunit ribosomal protein S14
MKYLVEKDKKRRCLFYKHEKKRVILKALLQNENLSRGTRWKISHKLSSLSRNSCLSRVRNRCVLSGRPRGIQNYFKMSRIMLRDGISNGRIPGITKSSW